MRLPCSIVLLVLALIAPSQPVRADDDYRDCFKASTDAKQS